MSGVQPESLAEYILVEYRWVVVITALMPLSLLWKIWLAVRNYVVFALNSAPKMHDKKVRNVQKQVKTWLSGDRSTKLCTSRPGWQTMSFRQGLYKKIFTNIDVNLVDVLEVDTKNMIFDCRYYEPIAWRNMANEISRDHEPCNWFEILAIKNLPSLITVRCEPLVTMGQLSKTLQSFGLALAIVPELDKLTVGGLVMGTGVETSSHIHGLFQHICVQYELVLADGSVLTCNKDENPDLFYAVPWSYGTLGFLVSVVIKVIPAKKFVRLQYHPYTNLPELTKRFKEESLKQDPHQFIETLLFDKDSGVLMLGDMVDEVADDGQLNLIGNWYSEWFFTQVQRRLINCRRGRQDSPIEYIPLRHYYHRHTRSFFWELQDIISFGNNVIFRYLFGWLMPPEVSLLKLTQPQAVTKLYERAHVIQDMLVPIDTLEEAILLFHKEFEVYPIWLCPFKVFNNPGQLKVSTADDWQMFVDIGVYGVPKAKCFETVPSTRRIENFVIEKRGFQMLYADTYTTREEFRQMFDHTLYDKLRESLPYCKDAFPEIYGKVNRSVRK